MQSFVSNDSNYTFIEDGIKITAFPTHKLREDVKKKDPSFPQGPELTGNPGFNYSMTIKVNYMKQEYIYYSSAYPQQSKI